MRIEKKSNGKTEIGLGQSDWIRIGEQTGWLDWDLPRRAAKDEEQIDYHLDRLPFRIEIDKYSDRTWAIYINGELLAVTVYRRGAEAIKDLLEQINE